MREWSLELWTYLKLVAGKWYILLFLALDALGLVAVMFSWNVQLPVFVYWGTAVVGLVLAGFEIYRDQQKAIASHKAKIEEMRRIAEMKPKPAEPEPALALELIEGTPFEYSFNVQPHYAQAVARKDSVGAKLAALDAWEKQDPAERPDPDWDEMPLREPLERRLKEHEEAIRKFRRSYVTPPMLLTLHLRITNTGNTLLQVLEVIVTTRPTASINFGMGKLIDLYGVELNYPLEMEPKAVLLCNTTIEMLDTYTLTPAQFAARLAEATRPEASHIPVTVDVEVFVPAVRERRPFTGAFNISTRPIKDKYVARWTDLGDMGLVQLASVHD